MKCMRVLSLNLCATLQAKQENVAGSELPMGNILHTIKLLNAFYQYERDAPTPPTMHPPFAYGFLPLSAMNLPYYVILESILCQKSSLTGLHSPFVLCCFLFYRFVQFDFWPLGTSFVPRFFSAETMSAPKGRIL